MTHQEKYRPLVVERVEDEAAGVVSLTLASPDGATLPAWEPGAHVDVVLGDASDADAMVRRCSLCSSPTDASWRIAVLRESGGAGSTWVHDHVRVGDTLRVATTRGTFPLDPAAAAEDYAADRPGCALVLEGSPDHRDQPLSDEEREANDTMMVCVSRCLGGRLVLDV